MIAKLKAFFEKELLPNAKKDSQQATKAKLQQACAILLIEIAKADFHQTEEEKSKINVILKTEFDLSDTKLAELIALCEGNETDVTSMYPFTSLINEHYEYPAKVNIVKLMWKVAYADGDLNKYEDHLIRKVADLLYISHRDFIQTKLDVAEN